MSDLSAKSQRVATFFDDCPILEDLRHLEEFSFAVRHTTVSALTKPEVQVLIADHLQQEIAAFLTRAEMHELEVLRPRPGDKEISVAYEDDLYHFAAALNATTFAVIRKRSTLEEFHNFYTLVAPFIPELYRSVVNRLEGSTPFKITPYECAYRFKLRLADFRPSGKTHKKRILNTDLMQRLVPVATTPLAELAGDAWARIDVKASAWRSFGEKTRNIWVNLEAPGNRDNATLELAFTYQSTTRSATGGKRTPFDDSILTEYDVALVDFFKTLVLNKLMITWLKDVSFDSAI